MNELKDMVYKHLMAKLFDRPFFSLCSVEDIIDLLQADYLRVSPVYKSVKYLHMVHWSEMPDALKSKIKADVIEMLQVKI